MTTSMQLGVVVLCSHRPAPSFLQPIWVRFYIFCKKIKCVVFLQSSTRSMFPSTIFDERLLQLPKSKNELLFFKPVYIIRLMLSYSLAGWNTVALIGAGIVSTSRQTPLSAMSASQLLVSKIKLEWHVSDDFCRCWARRSASYQRAGYHLAYRQRRDL